MGQLMGFMDWQKMAQLWTAYIKPKVAGSFISGCIIFLSLEVLSVIYLQENAHQLWSSIINKKEASSKASSIKERTVIPVIPQRDGIQDDYNDV
jgi:hypothetical protein